MMFKKFYKIPAYILYTVLYYFTYIFSKDENIWLFGAWFGEKYSDNSKYLFEYALNKKKNIYWITKNKLLFEKLHKNNIPVLYMYSLKGVYMTLKAKVIIMNTGIDDINFGFLINSSVYKVQLWHGIGNKRIGFNISSVKKNSFVVEKIKKIFFPYLISNRYDMVLSTSKIMQDRFSKSFGICESKIPILGYPRNDIFYKKEVAKNEFTIFYVPTHRKKGNGDLTSYIPNLEELKNINKICEKYQMKFYMKLHFYDEAKISKKDLENFQYISLVKDTYEFDMQVFLNNTDILITDYSSVYFDYLLLDRSVIFSAFDLKEYEMNDQGSYEALEKIAAGPICSNWDEVLEQMVKLKSDEENIYSQKMKEVRDRFHKYQDGYSSKRVFEYIERNF